VELEPVTCWPLIISAVGFVCLSLFAVTGFAAWSALFPPPKPAAVVEVSKPEPAYVRSGSFDLPAQPAASTDNERQVKMHREVVQEYHPLPPVPRRAVESHLGAPLRARRGAYKLPAERIPILPARPVRSESDLLAMLWKHTTPIDLETKKGAGNKMLEAGKKHAEARLAALKVSADSEKHAKGKSRSSSEEIPPLTKNIADLLNSRPDLSGLPLQDEMDCQSGIEATKALAEVSARVRRLQFIRVSRGDRGDSTSHDVADGSLVEYLRQAGIAYANKPIVVRPLEQMFQAETAPLRRDLVETLTAIRGREATQALARRAVFDLSPEVRNDAVRALTKRSLDEARPVFFAALRHPWAPAADHAAVALAKLNDQKAVKSLEDLVDQPDPCQPFQEGKKWYVREVVRVNHLRNCLLCHAVSLERRDTVRGPIPTPGERLPVVYYSSRSTVPSIRADIVYFRQDFSAMHAVDKPEKWPKYQRFDYLVRKRELTASEIEDLPAKSGKDRAGDWKSYPQRDAVLYTLYQLAFARRPDM
jgi:hypothetical protein